MQDQLRNKKVYRHRLKIVHENETWAVVQKPAGMITSGNKFRTLENTLPHNLKKSADQNALTHPQPCHRLDYATSGLVLVAKTHFALQYFKKAFEARNIQKTYHAVVVGAWTKESVLLDTDIDGKQSETQCRVVARASSMFYTALTFLKIEPKTGRRHQIRKHLAEYGTPVLGDRDYAQPDQRLRGKGMFLCATALSFCAPEGGKSYKFEIQPPGKFSKTLERQQKMFEKHAIDSN